MSNLKVGMIVEVVSSGGHSLVVGKVWRLIGLDNLGATVRFGGTGHCPAECLKPATRQLTEEEEDILYTDDSLHAEIESLQKDLNYYHDYQDCCKPEYDTMDLNKGDKVSVRAYTSKPGKGLTYIAMQGVLMDDAGGSEGWDVVDICKEDGEEVSIYCFSIIR